MRADENHPHRVLRHVQELAEQLYKNVWWVTWRACYHFGPGALANACPYSFRKTRTQLWQCTKCRDQVKPVTCGGPSGHSLG